MPQTAPFLSGVDELIKGLKDALDGRVFVGMSRGVWDGIAQAVLDGLCSIEDGDAYQVTNQPLNSALHNLLASRAQPRWVPTGAAAILQGTQLTVARQ